MRIEVLLATMFYEKEKDDFLKTLNVKTDIIIGNQTDLNKNEVFEFGRNKVTVLSRAERGVGKNRNASLFYSDADIVIFADNDVQYFDDYAEKIEEFYTTHPDADVVIFNFKVQRGDGPLRDINKKNKKAGLLDITKFGTWAVSVKRESILKKRISFSLLFGGGAKYSAGEDSLFLMDCYKRGLKIYLSDATLGKVIHRESTWYQGINEKLIFDRGALYAAMSPRWYRLFIFEHVLKHGKMYKDFGTAKDVVKMMLKGAKEYLI